MRNILLTGITGFLGSHLAKSFLEKNYNVVAVIRATSDIRRIKEIFDKIKLYKVESQLEKVFSENKIDIIVHTATSYGRNIDDFSTVVESNVVFPLKLLKFAEKSGVKLFINSDTFTKPEYGRLQSYALSKKQFKEWLFIYSKRISVLNFVLHHIYGEDDNRDKFIPMIIEKLISSVESIDLTLGEQKRDFVYIEDVCRAYLKAVEKFDLIKGFEEYEIGTGKSTSIKDVVFLIRDLVGNNKTVLNFGALSYSENEEFDTFADSKEFVKKFGWIQEFTLEQGLKNTVDWYKKKGER